MAVPVCTFVPNKRDSSDLAENVWLIKARGDIPAIGKCTNVLKKARYYVTQLCANERQSLPHSARFHVLPTYFTEQVLNPSHSNSLASHANLPRHKTKSNTTQDKSQNRLQLFILRASRPKVNEQVDTIELHYNNACAKRNASYQNRLKPMRSHRCRPQNSLTKHLQNHTRPPPPKTLRQPETNILSTDPTPKPAFTQS